MSFTPISTGAFLALICLSFASPAQATDLGETGNLKALKTFQNYQSATPVCDPAAPGRRVLLTGFGLFQDLSFNIAGFLAANIADPKIWPAKSEVNGQVTLSPTAPLQSGKYITSKGAQSFTRALTLGQTEINLCVLVLDVRWDVAGAIVSFEMNRFQPETVLMLGSGAGANLEGGALNQTSTLEGFAPDGSSDLQNIPQAEFNLPDEPSTGELPMLWDNQMIAHSVAPLLASAGLTLTTAAEARPDNTYLCNHVAYVALATASNRTIDLAGGLIHLTPKIQSNPKVGFFHLPGGMSPAQDTLERWGSLVTSVLYFMGH